MVDVDVLISNHFKQALAWAANKWLRVISTIMVFKNSKNTKELKGTKE